MPKAGSAAQKARAKGSKKKKLVDPFLKKDWYVIKVPTWIPRREDHFRVGFTPATKGKQRKAMENRTFTINLGDLQDNSQSNNFDDLNWKKYRFIAEEVFGDKVLTQWYGMEITRDKRCSLIRKWHSMLECFCDAKTSDGYVLRVKAIAFTQKQKTQIKKNCYVKRNQVWFCPFYQFSNEIETESVNHFPTFHVPDIFREPLGNHWEPTPKHSIFAILRTFSDSKRSHKFHLKI